MKKTVNKILKITSITILSLLLLMAAVPLIFPGTIKEQVKSLVNKSLKSTFGFKDAKLSFFADFPNLTVSLYDYYLTGSAPYDRDTLVSGREIALGINLLSLFGEEIVLNSVFIDETQFKIITGENGTTNFDVFIADENEKQDTGAKIKINKVRVVGSSFRYYDEPSTFRMEALNFKYWGKGNLADEEFRLRSNFISENFTISYGGIVYLDQKNLHARLLTNINTTSLTFSLLKNEVEVEDLVATFNGELIIMEDGFDIDLSLNTNKVDFGDLFSLIPKEYSGWLKNTRFGGSSSLSASLTGSSRDSLNTFPDLIVNLDVEKGKIEGSRSNPPVEGIEFKGSLKLPSLDYKNLELNIDTVGFSVENLRNGGRISVKGFDNPEIKGHFNGMLDLDMLTKAMGFTSLQFGGKLDYSAKAEGIYNSEKRELPVSVIKLKLSNGLISAPDYPGSVSDLNADVLIESKTGKYSDLSVVIDPVTLMFENRKFNITANLSNFDNLKYDIVSEGNLNLDNIYKLLKISGTTIRGEITSNLRLKGTQADATSGKYNKLNNSGTLGLKNFEYQSDDYKFPFRVPNATFTIDGDRAWLKDATLIFSRNTFLLDGYAGNFMGYYFEGKKLEGNMTLKSSEIFLDDFMSFMEPGSTNDSLKSSEGVIQVPKNMDLLLKADIQNIYFDSIKAKRLNGSVAVTNGGVELRKGRINIAGAQFNLDASYMPVSKDRASFDMKVKADSFNIKRAYNEIPMFRRMLASAGSMEGTVSTQYSLKGSLDENMEPLFPSLKGGGFIRLEDIKVKGLKVLGAVSRATGRDSINNPHLKAVMIKSTISNNIIKIERTKMKIFGFRPRFEGEASLDGKLNIRFRLGLPPLGIIGIPVTITGTFDNPKINMRRSKEGDKIVEDIEENVDE